MLVITDAMKNGKQYNGNTRKFGVTIKGTDCIIKFAKDNDLSVYSEYIASNFIRKLGVSCHKVCLGEYKGETVDVIADFTAKTCSELHSFRDTKQSSEDTDISVKEYTYSDVLYLIDNHLKMTDENKKLAKQQFWVMFICDAILGNRDRHWGNWGYIVKNGVYTFAPLYDNGGSLYPGVYKVIDQYTNASTRKQFLYDRIMTVPASLFKIKRSDRSYRSNYYEMFQDLRVNKTLAKAVRGIKSKFRWQDIYSIVYNIVNPLDLLIEYKKFYVEIITLRYRCIILRDNFDKAFKDLEDLLWQGELRKNK